MRKAAAEPFDADRITLENWHGFLPVRKRPIVSHACQMNLEEGFAVTTPTGRVIAEDGDYLMIGVMGEKWPIKKEIFEQTYIFVGDDETEVELE